MAQTLVIVESAAKSKTIQNYLGGGYVVRACFGHVRDLPTDRIGVDVDRDFAAEYVVPEGRARVVKELKAEARAASLVLLASDPDREGEAIAWHLVAALGLKSGTSVRRIAFQEITRGAILKAVQQPRAIDTHLVDAQQARRILDRLIGYPVSQVLGRTIQRGLSAGRVQSVAVRLVVDREREIEAFVPVEYWSLEAQLRKRAAEEEPSFVASLVARDEKKLALTTAEETQVARAHVAGASWSVASVKARQQQRNPAPPFTTSTLQQEASRKLNFGPKRTMVTAQQLYEGVPIDGETVGLITYMRTDSVNVAATAQQEARAFILELIGPQYVPPTARVYKNKNALAQEAHEAIRPTSIRRLPADTRPLLTADQAKLYELIWKRFLASQMAAAVFDVTTVEIDALGAGVPGYRFRATGSRPRFLGFLRVYREGKDDTALREEERQPLPALAAGDSLDLLQLLPKQHFTEAPPRYTEATLVKALEERGIGRPSTYAPTLATIQDRAYVELDGKMLRPTDLGQQVNDFLVAHFSDVVDLAFTAELEARLDEIARGLRPWVPTVSAYYQPLAAHLRSAATVAPALGSGGEPCNEVCSQGHAMVVKEGRTGRFLACSTYPDHKETRPLATQSVGVSCPACGSDIVEKHTRSDALFFGCSAWPTCNWTSSYRPLREACPACGGVQVDLDGGAHHCLKHQGVPPRRAPSAGRHAATAVQGSARQRPRSAQVRVSGRRTPGRPAPTPGAKNRPCGRAPRKPTS
jgi:DNA topoisomerase-1